MANDKIHIDFNDKLNKQDTKSQTYGCRQKILIYAQATG